MSEEIADLTGKRVNDERYAKNVIFDENGLNELLGEIRDYPIVDVDYIAEDETDELNTDKLVWQTYTNDTPCIKVIYGDKTNPNGNLTPADMKQIRELRNKIALYNGVHALYDKYAVIEDEYKTLIQNIETELRNIIINVCNTYNKYLNSGGQTPSNNTAWAGTYYKMYQDGKEQYPTGLDDFEQHIYPGFRGDGTTDNQGLYYKITFSTIDILSRLESIINDSNGIDALQFYNIEYGLRNDSPVNPAEPDENGKYYIIPLMMQRPNYTADDIANITWTGRDLYDTLYPVAGTWTITGLDKQFATYNDLLQQTIEALTYKYVKNTESFDNNKAYYTYSDNYGYTWEKGIGGFTTGVTYYVREGNDGTDHIRSLLATYAEYIRQARVNQMEAIRQYLVAHKAEDTNNALASEVTQYDMTNNEEYPENNPPYRKVYDYVMSQYFEQSVANIEQEIKNKLEDVTVDKYTEVQQNDSFNSSASYYEKDAQGRFIQVNINSETFNNYPPHSLYTLNDEAIPAIYGYKYVPVGSNIRWDDNQVYPTVSNSTARDDTSGTNNYIYPEVDPESNQRNGHFRININGHVYEIGIKGLEYSNSSAGVITIGKQGTATTTSTAQLVPANYTNSTLGTSGNPWDKAYITTANINNLTDTDGIISIGNAGSGNTSGIAQLIPADNTNSSLGTEDNPWDAGYFSQITIGTVTIGGNGGTGDTTKFLRGDGQWSNTLTADLNITSTADGTTSSNNTYTGNTNAAIHTCGGIYAAKNIWAAKVFNAVFNDYAEYRKTCESVKPGQCVYEKDDGSLAITDHFLMPGAQVVSDTFGHIMGGSEDCTTPLAVAGRVLVYPYQDRKNYHAGMCVCAAPGGTVNIMSRKDIMEYPDCIVGIVSEIPDYEYWGTDNVKVDGRIWIKVR